MAINYDNDSWRDISIRWLKETEKKLAECLPAVDAAAYNIAQYEPSLWEGDDCPIEQLVEYRRVVGRCGWFVSQMFHRLMPLSSTFNTYSLQLLAYAKARGKEDDGDAEV